MGDYNLKEEITKIEEPSVGYLISYTQKGMPFHTFENQTSTVPFNQSEWSDVLHLSERTFQRYKKEDKKFESIYTEKILEIIILFKRGVTVFGNENLFYGWLNISNLALGDIKPFSIIDNTFGIKMVSDELGRIEHGIFA